MSVRVNGTLIELQRTLAHALGPHVGVVASGVDGDVRRLYPEEAIAVARAIDRRQREFAAGRESARLAMRAIGWPEAPVPSGTDRSPQWPQGLTGSISHTRDACLVAVASSARVRALGLDIEMHAPIEPALWPLICTPTEQENLLALPAPERGLAVVRVFSAKEAVFKWQYPVHGQMLEFQDVEICLLDGMNGFAACILPALEVPSACAARTTGRILCSPDHVVSWVITPESN